MKRALISATLVGVMTATPSHAAIERRPIANPLVSGEEGGGGGRGIKVASLVNTTLLFVPDAVAQSPLIAVGEGGEGGRGRKFRKSYRNYAPDYGRYERYERRSYGSYGQRWQGPMENRSYYDRRYYVRPYRY